jgi:hypothetical protein
MKDTTRVQIELPPASMERLRVLKEKTEASSYAEVTKNAFRLYERIIELTGSGNTLLLRDRDGNIKQLELFL